jgi:hypothetical protein
VFIQTSWREHHSAMQTRLHLLRIAILPQMKEHMFQQLLPLKKKDAA